MIDGAPDWSGVGGGDDFDPHAILGLSPECMPDEVRRACLRHSKDDHPGRCSAAAVPPEVRACLETMARRVNAAYAALEVVTATGRRRAG